MEECLGVLRMVVTVVHERGRPACRGHYLIRIDTDDLEVPGST